MNTNKTNKSVSVEAEALVIGEQFAAGCRMILGSALISCLDLATISAKRAVMLLARNAVENTPDFIADDQKGPILKSIKSIKRREDEGLLKHQACSLTEIVDVIRKCQ